MDYSKVFTKHYGNLGWACNMTYDSIIWNGASSTKPTNVTADHVNDTIRMLCINTTTLPI